MNKSTYKAIDTLKANLLELNLKRRLKLFELQDAADMAQTDYDEKSEKWQESDAGAEELERISELNQAIEALNEAAQLIESAIGNIEAIEGNAPEGVFN